MSDVTFMKAALKQAEKALSESEVPVGAVFVFQGNIIGQGHNLTNETKNATEHAELVAIGKILQSGFPFAQLSAVDVYVTVEPCIMCAAALILVGVKKVYFGCKNDKFGGCGSVLSVNSVDGGIQHLNDLPCVGGICEEEAIALLQTFYSRENPLGRRQFCRGGAAFLKSNS